MVMFTCVCFLISKGGCKRSNASLAVRECIKMLYCACRANNAFCFCCEIEDYTQECIHVANKSPESETLEHVNLCCYSHCLCACGVVANGRERIHAGKVCALILLESMTC